MPENNSTSFPKPPEWGESPKPPERRKTPDELKRELAKLIGEVGDASATNSDQKGNGSRPLLWDDQKGIVDSTTDMIAAEDEIEVMAEVATPEEQVSESRETVLKTVQTTEEMVKELEKDVPEAAETDPSAHAT